MHSSAGPGEMSPDRDHVQRGGQATGLKRKRGAGEIEKVQQTIKVRHRTCCGCDHPLGEPTALLMMVGSSQSHGSALVISVQSGHVGGIFEHRRPVLAIPHPGEACEQAQAARHQDR